MALTFTAISLLSKPPAPSTTMTSKVPKKGTFNVPGLPELNHSQVCVCV